MTKKIISRATALLTVALFATVALAGTASATLGDVTTGDVAFRGLGNCRGDYSDDGGTKTCTGVWTGPSGYFCVGKYIERPGDPKPDCEGVDNRSS